ncbi:MAG: hypothetical protein JWP59_2589 [Massilia sp.]|jgi:hypothetical protein|nr:hypothetical protein [Massilia sp.]
MAAQTEHMGMNKTGIQMSPLQTRAMLSEEYIATRGTEGDETQMAVLRQAYMAESDNVGSIPPPGTMTGAVSMGVHLLSGDRPHVLVDKLAERLAMERTATRLYDALLTKLDAFKLDVVKLDPLPISAGLSITRAEVASIRGDEARHALMIRDAIESIGADPTAMTPCADIAGVEALGLVQVLTDPRTSLAQSLHAILTAELSDGVGWETLIALADENHQPDMVDQFSGALQQERKHQLMIRTWFEQAIGLVHVDSARSLHEASGAAAAESTPGGTGAGQTS